MAKTAAMELNKVNAKLQGAEVKAAAEKNKLSLLLYLETRAVDYAGRVDPMQMNAADFAIAKEWADETFIEFGRICHNDGGGYWCRLSDQAWKIAHSARRNRSDIYWLRRSWKTTVEEEAKNDN